MRYPLVYKLFFTWTGWPADGGTFPPDPGEAVFDQLRGLWSGDGILFLGQTWQPDQVQVACEVEPSVSPVFFTGRIKGRLQHAMRLAGSEISFSRKVGMRAIGDNLTEVVEGYLKAQLEHVDLADQRYRQSLADAAIADAGIDLSEPAETGSGRYWYNLHVVLVAEGRYRIGKEDALLRVRPAVQAFATDGGHGLKALAVMPDHVHVAVRGNIAKSAGEIAQELHRALNRAAGCALYSDRVYVGTFSEYTLRALG